MCSDCEQVTPQYPEHAARSRPYPAKLHMTTD
jgi:hypothetical protein